MPPPKSEFARVPCRCNFENFIACIRRLRCRRRRRPRSAMVSFSSGVVLLKEVIRSRFISGGFC